MGRKALNAKQRDRLPELVDGMTEAFWEAIAQQTKLEQEHGRPRYTIPEVRAAIAHVVAQLVSSAWCAANPDLNMWERPPQYEAEMLKFVDDVRMAIDAITSPDE